MNLLREYEYNNACYLWYNYKNEKAICLILDKESRELVRNKLITFNGKYFTIVIRKPGNTPDKFISVHRLILNQRETIKNKAEVDHINRNTQDNRISNLRIVSRVENCRNKKRKSSTGYYNVYKAGKKWRVRIKYKGEFKHFGVYPDKEIAALVADYLIKLIHPNTRQEFLNFPDKSLARPEVIPEKYRIAII
jgi:hypothetical protein